MSNPVTVLGVQKEMGGLKESMAAWRRNNVEVSNALLNITEGKDKDEVRQSYVFQPYPTALYRPDKMEFANSSQEKANLIQRGFRPEPYPKPQIEVLDPAVEKKALQDKNNELQGQIIRQQDALSKMMERLEALEKAKRA